MGFFLPVSKLFLYLLPPLLLLLLPSRRRKAGEEEKEEKEGPIGSSCHSLLVTYECRKFSMRMRRFRSERDPPFHRPVKSSVIQRAIVWKFIGSWIFVFFRGEGNTMEELIFFGKLGRNNFDLMAKCN